MNANDAPLQPYQWDKRILLIFYNQGNDDREIAVAPRWNLEKSAYYQYKTGILDRDMLVLFVTEQLVDPLLLERQDINWNKLPSQTALHNAYAPEFEKGQIYTSFLIGKDGLIKQSWDKLAPMKEVFARIDTMPMRQREMRDSPLNE